MTKKNYVAIASIIDLNHGGAFTETQLVLVHDLSDYFEQDNKMFDRERFLSACGIAMDGIKCLECGSGVDPYYRSCKNNKCYWTQ